ncbi:hypothetical protein EVAR_103118_1 [Eumeta japonica]|uniref:Uncharacterized protein n=1 Tax=Eumeta variegata TaxID=151549 RepID=A0A4C1X325_EUMVA|nr:hypothetical protein EVAR_103118_1 [Eumeta japonica]
MGQKRPGIADGALFVPPPQTARVTDSQSRRPGPPAIHSAAVSRRFDIRFARSALARTSLITGFGRCLRHRQEVVRPERIY